MIKSRVKGIDESSIDYYTTTLMRFEKDMKNSKITINSLRDFSYLGNVNKFRQQMSKLLKIKYKIATLDDIKKCNILTQKQISEWMKIAQDMQCETIVGFLSSLKNSGLQNIVVLHSMLGYNGSMNNDKKENGGDEDDNNNNESKKESENESERQGIKECFKTAEYLFSKCDSHTLECLSKVVNNALLKQECRMDDSSIIFIKNGK